MVYFRYRKIETPGFEDSFCEVVGVELDSKKLGVAEFLSNSENFSKASVSGMDIKLIWLPENNKPTLILKNVNSPDCKSIRIDDVIGLLETGFNKNTNSIPNEMLKQAETIVANRYPNDAKDRILFCYGYLIYLNSGEYEGVLNIGSDNIDDGDYFVIANNKIQQHNEKFTSVFTSMSSADNVTLFQNVPTDKLFIMIPDRNTVLTTDEIAYGKLIPRLGAVCDPYTDKNAYSPNYRDLGVPRHMLSAIEGNVENNTLPIQDNEQDFYKALMDWTAYNIKTEFGSNAEGLEDGSATIDALSQSFLAELADRIYSWHWAHNPNMPSSFGDGDGESDEDDDDSAAANSADGESRYSFDGSALSDDSLIINAVIVLNSYLEEASTKLGYRVYPEAIIKLARWGERKPTALVLDGYEIAFDLATNSVKRNMGSISDYTIEEVNGYKEQAVRLIYINDYPADPNIGSLSDLPVGLTTVSKYKNGESVVEVETHYPIWDLIPGVLDGTLKIGGVTESGVTANLEQVDLHQLMKEYDFATDEFLQNPFFRSNELKDLCIAFGANLTGSRQNLMSILQEAIKSSDLSVNFEEYKITDIDDVQKLIISGKAYSTSAILITNVARVLYRYYGKAKQSFDSGSDWFGSWKNALSDWDKLASVYTTKSSREDTNQSNSQAMTSFGGQSAQQVTSMPQQAAQQPAQSVQNTPVIQSTQTQSTSSGSVLIKSAPAGTLKPIFGESGEIIGGFVREIYKTANGKKRSKYYIVNKSTWFDASEDRRSDAGAPIYKLFPHFLDNLTLIALGRPDEMLIYFDSPETIHELTIYFSKLSKERSAREASAQQ